VGCFFACLGDGTDYEVRYAKEKSFWSSFSRKACGELERQSLSVKAQKRRDHIKINSRLSTRHVKKRAVTKIRWNTILSTCTLFLGAQTARAEIGQRSESDFSTRGTRGDLIQQYV
jgi:hypothetical protein